MSASAAAARALVAARDSLEDARLLEARGRRTAAVLLDLALRQALGAISLSLKLDAPEGLPLDILLGRVPSDHPASELAGRLADPRERDADTVQQLIDALRLPAPVGAKRVSRRTAAAKDVLPHRPVPMEPEPAAVVADGPTAFELARARREAAASDRSAEREQGRPGGHEASSIAFWSLIDRWPVSDQEALSLLGGGRDLTGKGTRPRFRLRGAEARRYAMLGRIDTALEVLGEGLDWLCRAQTRQPFGGRTPLALLVENPDTAGERILHALNKAGLRAASRSGRQPDAAPSAG